MPAQPAGAPRPRPPRSPRQRSLPLLDISGRRASPYLVRCVARSCDTSRLCALACDEPGTVASATSEGSDPHTRTTLAQTVALPAVTLKLGDHGIPVKELQRALRSSDSESEQSTVSSGAFDRARIDRVPDCRSPRPGRRRWRNHPRRTDERTPAGLIPCERTRRRESLGRRHRELQGESEERTAGNGCRGASTWRRRVLGECETGAAIPFV